MINRNRDSNSVLGPRIHHSSPSASASYAHSPTARKRRSSSASYPYPHSSSTTSSPTTSLFIPTRTEVVREELAQCQGMDSAIQDDDVRGYFDRLGLPTPDSMPRRRTTHHTSLSSPTRTMPMSPIGGTPTPNALAPPIPSPPAMKSLTPPLRLHHERQTSSLFSSYQAAQASSSSGCTEQQWHPQASSIQPMIMPVPPGPDSLLTPTPMYHDRWSGSTSSSHYRQSSGSSSHSRNRNGQPIASGSQNTTHAMPPAPVPGSSRNVRYTQPKPGSSAHSHRGGVHSTRTRGEGRSAHTRKPSTSEGIRIVTIYDVRGFEGVEPDPQFPNMMVVDRTGGEPMVVYRSGDVSGVGYDMYGVHGGTGNHDQSLGR
ncbi:hypothetical protein BJ165DRAFT_1535213 [Panaeolus papilionaceus]|nr:hypothetical protein BJ165DRAFT_1535213 [Panaeolus papilionaceus]